MTFFAARENSLQQEVLLLINSQAMVPDSLIHGTSATEASIDITDRTTATGLQTFTESTGVSASSTKPMQCAHLVKHDCYGPPASRCFIAIPYTLRRAAYLVSPEKGNQELARLSKGQVSLQYADCTLSGFCSLYLFTRCTSASSLSMKRSSSLELQQFSSPSLHASGPC